MRLTGGGWVDRFAAVSNNQSNKMNPQTIGQTWFIVAALAVWYAPVVIVAALASNWLGKSAKKVLIAGAVFGVIGAAVAAALLPKEDAAQAVLVKASTDDQLPIGLILGGLGVCAVILVAFIGFLAML